MTERKNIDRVFQERFKDLEIVPSKKVWHNIEQSLNEKHYRKTITLWKRLSGIAMLLVLFLSIGIWYYDLNTNTQTIFSGISNTDKEIKTNQKTNPTKTNFILQNSKIKLAQTKRENSKSAKKQSSIFIKSPNNKIITTTTDISTVYKAVENKYIVDKDDFIKQIRSESGLLSDINSEISPLIENLNKSKKWSVGPTVAPVYYNTLQSGSPISEDLSNNSKTMDDALSVGVKVNYQLTKKIKLQSGVNKVELAYNTKGVNAFISSEKNALSNSNTSRSGVVLTPVISQNFDLQSVGGLNKSDVNGDINQSLEYFELPIEMKYNIFDSKLGVNIVGGVSTYFLTKNSLSLISQNQITNLGGANNLNSINFSGNLGFDLDYKLTKSWYLNVAPMFKYQFNTYSNGSGNFKPYYFGVYSGLNFKF